MSTPCTSVPPELDEADDPLDEEDESLVDDESLDEDCADAVGPTSDSTTNAAPSATTTAARRRTSPTGADLTYPTPTSRRSSSIGPTTPV